MTESQLRVQFDDLKQDVLARRGLTLVDFWAEIVPCRQLSRQLEQLMGEISPEVRVGTVNARENPDLTKRYGVRSVPTLLFVKDGLVRRDAYRRRPTTGIEKVCRHIRLRQKHP